MIPLRYQRLIETALEVKRHARKMIVENKGNPKTGLIECARRGVHRNSERM